MAEGTGSAAQLAQEAVKERGLCGALDDDNENVCIMDADHEGRHGWQNEPGYYDIALRPDEPDGELLDDVVVCNVLMFHMEQMDRGHWWLACYLPGGDGQERISFDLHWKKRTENIEMTVQDTPSDALGLVYEEGSLING